ncbi:hypothetical protein [Streptomyces malaysiensis]
MATLAEVAEQYQKEANKVYRPTPAGRRAEQMAAFLRRAVANRAGIDPARHKLTFDGNPRVSVAWAQRHGYRALVTPGGIGTGAGLMLQRDNEPPVIAQIGDTLTWDGERIAVEQPEAPRP